MNKKLKRASKTMNVNDIYTPLQEAKAELERRWNDEEFRNRVEEYLGREHLPDYFFEKPHAISIEDVASPNLYTWTFVSKANQVGLDPLHFEFLDDIFITTNHDKASLAKMSFYHGLDDLGNMIKSVRRIINLDGSEEKKKLKEIRTLDGGFFVEFHRNLMLKNFPGAKIFDGSEWFRSKGGCAKTYYKHVLAMSLCHGILFDNFLDYDYESDLVRNILLPAFMEIEREFGYRPLIVAVAPTDKSLEKHWLSYPEFIKIYLD